MPIGISHIVPKIQHLSDYAFKVTSNIFTYFNIDYIGEKEAVYVAEVECVGEKFNNTFVSIELNNTYKINIDNDNPKELEFSI